MARAEVREPERLRAILESATRMAADQLEVERVGVWLIDPEAGTLTQGLLYVRSSQSHSREPTVLSVADHPEYFEAMEQRRALVVEDTRASPHAQTMFREVLEPHRIGSLLDTPIFRQGVLFGVV